MQRMQFVPLMECELQLIINCFDDKQSVIHAYCVSQAFMWCQSEGGNVYRQKEK